MKPERFQELKAQVRMSDKAGKEQRHKELLAIAERDCSPQQKSALTRMLQQRERDWEIREMEQV